MSQSQIIGASDGTGPFPALLRDLGDLGKKQLKGPAQKLTKAVSALWPVVDCEHISTEDDGTGHLLISSSKTDQIGQGAIVPLSKTTRAAVAAYRKLVGIKSGPATGFVGFAGRIMSPRAVCLHTG